MDVSDPVKRFTYRILGKGDNKTWKSATETYPVITAQPPLSSTLLRPALNTASCSTDPFQMTSNLGAKVISCDSKTEVEFDIWLVHGLMGNRTKTWTHENGTFWPSLLADDFPQARVITYGYDADVVKFADRWKNASSQGLKSYGQSLAFALRNSRQGIIPVPASRPIYFIGHSLGGLVIQQALLICVGPNQALHEIAAATAGIIFMGTPHDGSHLARWGSTLVKLIPENIRSTNTKILKVLERESDVCKDLEEAFQTEAKHGRFKKIKLFCFYETIAMPGLSRMIVPEKSATLRADFNCPIHGTHTSMVRFPGPDDDGYLNVKGQLTTWILPKLNVKPVDKAETAKRLWKKGTKGKRQEMRSIRVIGPQFDGIVQGGTIHADQYTTGGNMHIQYSSNSRQMFYHGDEKTNESLESSGEDGEDDEDED